MTVILHIDSSPREHSLSRQLSTTFVMTLQQLHPSAMVVRRDLCQNPPPFIDSAWVKTAHLPLDQQDYSALTVSNELTDEFLNADIIVLGMPMYNLGMPANVKAWFDQIIREGKTFKTTDNGNLVGLVDNKKHVIAFITRNGKFLPQQEGAALNFQDGHFTALLQMMGIKNIHLQILQTSFNQVSFKADFEHALTESKKLAHTIQVKTP